MSPPPGDVEFKPATLDLPDDEETIAAEEEEEQGDVEEEIADLKKQSEMDINELLESLPPGILSSIPSISFFQCISSSLVLVKQLLKQDPI